MAYIQQKGADNLPVVPRVVQDRLNQALDSENGGVPNHLGDIAEFMYEWEGKVADELKLTTADVSNIKKLHPDRLNLQA